MKCIYYLVPTLDSTDDVAEDLHEVGVKDFYLHVISRDESGLKQHHLHSSNYLETLDIVRDGFIGAALGFVAGLIGIGLLAYFDPFAPYTVPTYVYVILTGVATLFGAWAGGLTGVDSENNKLKKFHDDLMAGKYLVLVYTRKHQEQAVRDMMAARHPEAELAAVDSHFINPFSSVARITATPAQRA